MHRVLRVNLLLVAGSAMLGVVLGEGVYRTLLFSHSSYSENLRDPALYTDRFSEDAYYKLRFLFASGSVDLQTRPPHPLLGWVGPWLSEDLRHPNADLVGTRRPVLLFGDSFAQCAGEAICFETLLNGDPDFSQHYYLLNYGISGYGLDQIYLMFKSSVDQFHRPFVIFSFMTLDLDRNLLAFRGKPKPRFLLAQGKLQLTGIPITTTSAQFIEANPVEIRSYLYRRLLHSPHFPGRIRSWLRSEDRIQAHKMALAEAILNRAIDDLRAKDLEFVVLVFHPHLPGQSSMYDESDWRDPLIRRVLDREDVRYIWSKQLVHDDELQSKGRIDQYIDPSQGHPTTHFNRLIASEIWTRIEESEGTQVSGPDPVVESGLDSAQRSDS